MWDGVHVEAAVSYRTTAFGRLIDIWSNGDPADILTLITLDYVGHMLHLEHGQRSAAEYPGWIQSFREAYPNTRFLIHDQSATGDRLWTRLQATREDGAVSNGMNISRFADGRIAEEWAIWSGWRFVLDGTEIRLPSAE
jgi:hypothetical protein